MIRKQRSTNNFSIRARKGRAWPPGAWPSCAMRRTHSPTLGSGAAGGAGGPGAHLSGVSRSVQRSEVNKHGALSAIVSVGCGGRSKSGGASGGPFLQYAPPLPDGGASRETHVSGVCRFINREVLSCSVSVSCKKRSKSGDASGGSFLQYASPGRASPGNMGQGAGGGGASHFVFHGTPRFRHDSSEGEIFGEERRAGRPYSILRFQGNSARFGFRWRIGGRDV